MTWPEAFLGAVLVVSFFGFAAVVMAGEDIVRAWRERGEDDDR